MKARLVRRGSRYVLAAPKGTPPLTNEQVRRTLKEIREGRIRKLCQVRNARDLVSVAPPGLDVREP